MSRSKVPFLNSLAGRMLIFGIIPTGLLMSGMVIFTAKDISADLRAEREHTLTVLAERVAAEVDRENMQAVLTARIMANAQVNGMFGKRERSSIFARDVLLQHPEFTAAYFGYEPNADGQDAEYVGSARAETVGPAFDGSGRFIPYWFRDKKVESRVFLTPLVDMETSLYYQGAKDQFLETGEAEAMVTEPYVYEGKMIVEQTYPIVIDGEFKGIAGVDRALLSIASFLDEFKGDRSFDIFLVSKSGNFVATTLGKIEFGDGTTDFLKTRSIAVTPFWGIFGKLHTERQNTQLTVAEDPILEQGCYYATAHVRTGDWMVVVRETEADILAPINEHIMEVIAGLVGVLTIIGLLGSWIARTATARIQMAVDAADRLAAGDLSTELELPCKSKDEAGLLGSSINALLGTYR